VTKGNLAQGFHCNLGVDLSGGGGGMSHVITDGFEGELGFNKALYTGMA
jgi:hypothetical protein